MEEKEPPWRAELSEELRIALGASNIENVYVRRMAHDAVFPSVVAAILAAEQRGRREALKERLNGLEADWTRFRRKVLAEAWEALRDAEGGPLVDGMSVINRLLESP